MSSAEDTCPFFWPIPHVCSTFMLHVHASCPCFMFMLHTHVSLLLVRDPCLCCLTIVYNITLDPTRKIFMQVPVSVYFVGEGVGGGPLGNRSDLKTNVAHRYNYLTSKPYPFCIDGHRYLKK
jgi:hypothetical protein